MIKSMTAYGQATMVTPFGQWVVEIHSVNRKYLELAIHLPKEMARFDMEVRKWVSEFLSRGQVTVRFHLPIALTGDQFFNASFSSLDNLKQFWEKMGAALGYDVKKEVHLGFLVSQMSLGQQKELLPEDSQIREHLKDLCEQSLQSLMTMKKKEGEALYQDIKIRLDTISQAVDKISEKGASSVEVYREKLLEKMEQFSLLTSDTTERISREIVLLAEKLDITEEIIRLKSHLSQFRNFLDSQEKSVGRTLDFLSQETGREINTIGAKSVDEEIIRYVITIKAELEKIREQAQNIE